MQLVAVTIERPDALFLGVNRRFKLVFSLA